MIDGKSSSSDERYGSVRLLDPDGGANLARIELEQVGIVALGWDPEASAAAGFDVMRAELYVEGVQVELAGADR